MKLLRAETPNTQSTRLLIGIDLAEYQGEELLDLWSGEHGRNDGIMCQKAKNTKCLLQERIGMIGFCDIIHKNL
jgi:hypothetical protein